MTRPPYPDDIPTAVTHREADLLAELMAGSLVLEVGAAQGFSTVWMALNNAHVLSIDPHTWKETLWTFLANIDRYGVQYRVEPFIGRSQEWPVRGGFDAAFIDGDHSYENAVHDLRLAMLAVKPGGWIIAHDYSFPGYGAGGWLGVVRAVDEVLGEFPERRRVGTIFAARLSGAGLRLAS